MTCSDNTCGTGIGTVILPGDPVGDSIVTAYTVFGGVDVVWTMPGTNAFAIAYTKVYRSFSNTFASAVPIGNAAGDRYFDRQDFANGVFSTTYYWVVFVSINGTEIGPYGPGIAMPQSAIDQIIENLTAKIDYGALSVALKGSIDKIDLNQSQIDVLFDGVASEQITIRQMLVDIQSTVDATTALITSEVAARQDGDSALVAQVDTLGVYNAQAQAAIQTETLARIAGDSANASQITTVQSTLNSSIASVQTSLTTNISKTNAIGALYTVKVNVNGLAGGFGIYNDGSTIEAGFDVGTFWVGSTSANKKKPFIVTGGVVYIDVAMINDATITTAKIASAAITAAKIADGTITTAKIGTAQIDTLRLAENAVSISQAATLASTTTNAIPVTVTTPNAGEFVWYGSATLSVNAVGLSATLNGLANGGLLAVGSLAVRVTYSSSYMGRASGLFGMYVEGVLVRTWTVTDADGITALDYTSIKTSTSTTNPVVDLRLISVTSYVDSGASSTATHSTTVTVEVFPNTSSSNGTSIYCVGFKR